MKIDIRNLKKANRKNVDKGQSLVELAISFLFLILLFAGIFDIGFLIFRLIQVRDAAEEVGTYISLNLGMNSTEICNRAKASSGQLDIDCAKIDYSDIDYGTNCIGTLSGGDIVTVTIDYDYYFMLPIIGSLIGSDHFTLSPSIKATVLTPVCVSP